MPIPPEWAEADVEVRWAVRGTVVTATRPLAGLRLQPPSPEILRRRGDACREAGREAEAAQWYARILDGPVPAEEVDHYDEALRFLVAATDSARRDPARAIRLGEALVARTHGRDVRTWYTLALAHRLRGERTAAERACCEALALRPGHTTLVEALAAIRMLPVDGQGGP